MGCAGGFATLDTCCTFRYSENKGGFPPPYAD